MQYHDYRMPAQPKNVRRAMNKIGEELFPYYLEIRKADTMAQSEYMREEKLSNIAGIERCYKEILKKKRVCFSEDVSSFGERSDRGRYAAWKTDWRRLAGVVGACD